MLELVIDNIFVMIGVFLQPTVSIPMGTNCTPFLVDLFVYSYEADFIKAFLKNQREASQIL